LIKFHRTKN